MKSKFIHHPLVSLKLKLAPIVIAIPLTISLALTACQAEETSPAVPGGQTQIQPGNDSPLDGAPEDPEAVQPPVPDDPNTLLLSWQSSPHADSFVLDAAGSNSRCARCHAPVNWIPTMDDMPESCLTCKFEVDPPPPLISESDWTHVECMVCHKVKKDEVQPEYAWLEIAPIEEYAEVATVTELCDKCHLAGDVIEHGSTQVTGDHPGYECTDCHNAHDTVASCSATGCHEDVVGPEVEIPGHDEAHSMIGCEACHDAGSMMVGPVEGRDIWSTFLLQNLEGVEYVFPQISHNIVKEAPCDRCHYANNEWGLSESVEN